VLLQRGKAVSRAEEGVSATLSATKGLYRNIDSIVLSSDIPDVAIVSMVDMTDPVSIAERGVAGVDADALLPFCPCYEHSPGIDSVEVVSL
jgi:hypothetical protein